jgi:DNA-binding LacI/PurR family transcriptional regulator
LRFIRNPTEDTPCGHTRDAIVRMILARGHRVGDKLPTYRDLAHHLGVAVRTVARAMSRLSDEGIVQLLHGKGAFVRKMPAGGNRLRTVGLVYPASRLHLVRTPYLNQILAGIVVQCDVQHIDLQIVAFRQAGRATYIADRPRDVALRVDGVLLLEVVNQKYIAEFAKEPVPLVLVDAQSRNSPLPSVCVDNATAVQEVMLHLHDLGHRRIAYVDSPSEDPMSRPGEPRWVDSADGIERREAYLREVERLGLDYRHIYRADDAERLDAARLAAGQIKADRRRPTAVLAYDEPLAGLLCESLRSLGVSVPETVSVAGAVGVRGTNVAGQLTVTCSIAQFEQMGHLAMQTLVAQTTDRASSMPVVQRVGSILQIGTSTATPCER